LKNPRNFKKFKDSCDKQKTRDRGQRTEETGRGLGKRDRRWKKQSRVGRTVGKVCLDSAIRRVSVSYDGVL
jgi:hypothetical protein